ncbi:hypothetical protein [Dyadobacter bucti]|uniref:hypothetical protein n=1 Tax=Dyadobacter bucti TaxID=2572203 RepID=UPI003F6FB596
MEKKQESLQCPSYIAKPGADLFGILGKDGKVEYLEEPIRIDKTFVEAAKVHEEKTGRSAEERFRFSGKCIEGVCSQWSHENSHCSLVGRVIEAMNKKVEAENSLMPCSIRHSCRWYAQQGALACANCNEIVRVVEQDRLNSLAA